jgi:hypothetical protein
MFCRIFCVFYDYHYNESIKTNNVLHNFNITNHVHPPQNIFNFYKFIFRDNSLEMSRSSDLPKYILVLHICGLSAGLPESDFVRDGKILKRTLVVAFTIVFVSCWFLMTSLLCIIAGYNE